MERPNILCSRGSHGRTTRNVPRQNNNINLILTLSWAPNQHSGFFIIFVNMMYQTQTLWLEETEESIKATEKAQNDTERLGIKIKIPKPIYVLYTRVIVVDLSLVTSIGSETISVGDKDFVLPQIVLINGEIHTLNEDTNELHKLILEAKKQERFIKSSLPRPINDKS